MAKLKKKTLDELDLEILAILHYKCKATATDLEKELEGKITKAGISKRLKWLAEKGYLEKPINDISTGKLKRIYKAPDREKLKEAFLEWFRVEIYEDVINSLYSEEKAQELRKELPPEEAYKENQITSLSFTPAKTLRKLREGISLEEAVNMFKVELNMEYPYSELFNHEITGLIAVKNGTVKLTKEGLEAVINEWIPEIKDKLTELRELDPEAYKKLLSEFCKDLAT